MPYNPGSLNHFMGDLYPNMGFMNTRFNTIAEPEDQVALVDNQKLAESHNVSVNPNQARSIWVSIGIVLVVIVLLNWR